MSAYTSFLPQCFRTAAIALALCCPTTQAFAAYSMGPSFSGVDLTKGFYSGLEFGDSNTDFGLGLASVRVSGTQMFPSTTTRSPLTADIDNDGYSARAFMGWMFHPNFGIELGVFSMKDINAKKLNYPIAGSATISGNEHEKSKVNLFVVDLAPKFVVPLTDQIRVFTRAGVAYIRTEAQDKVRLNAPPNGHLPGTRFELEADGADRFTFVLATGVAFALSNTMEIFAQWTYVTNSDFFTKDDNITTDIETKSIGVIYRAV